MNRTHESPLSTKHLRFVTRTPSFFPCQTHSEGFTFSCAFTPYCSIHGGEWHEPRIPRYHWPIQAPLSGQGCKTQIKFFPLKEGSHQTLARLWCKTSESCRTHWQDHMYSLLGTLQPLLEYKNPTGNMKTKYNQITCKLHVKQKRITIV